MNKTKVGLLAVTAAGVVAIAMTHAAGTDKPAERPGSTATAPAKAMPVAPAAAAPAKAAAPGAAPSAPAGPAGKAEIKDLVHDAGTVERGADINHAFTIKNVGQHDLTVDAKPG